MSHKVHKEKKEDLVPLNITSYEKTKLEKKEEINCILLLNYMQPHEPFINFENKIRILFKNIENFSLH